MAESIALPPVEAEQPWSPQTNAEPIQTNTKSSDSRNSPEMNVKQQAGCRLHAVALEQRLGCRPRHHIRVQPEAANGPPVGSANLDLDQSNLVRHEPTTDGSYCKGTRVGLGANAGWCGLRMCTSVDGTFRTCGVVRPTSVMQAKADIKFCCVTTPRSRGICLGATDEFSKTPSRYANEK